MCINYIKDYNLNTAYMNVIQYLCYLLFILFENYHHETKLLFILQAICADALVTVLSSRDFAASLRTGNITKPCTAMDWVMLMAVQWETSVARRRLMVWQLMVPALKKRSCCTIRQNTNHMIHHRNQFFPRNSGYVCHASSVEEKCKCSIF